MKTTVEIADDLLRRARAVAAKERTTLRALLEGLRWALGKRRQRETFEYRDASVPGNGVQPGVTEGDWATSRDQIYTGRGS